MSSLYNLTADYEHVLGMLYDDDYDEQIGDKESCEYCHLADQGESLRIR